MSSHKPDLIYERSPQLLYSAITLREPTQKVIKRDFSNCALCVKLLIILRYLLKRAIHTEARRRLTRRELGFFRMKLPTTMPTIDGATLQRLLRPQNLNPVLAVLKIVLAIVCFLFYRCHYCSRHLSYLNSTNTSATLQQAVEAAAARVQQQHDNPMKRPALSLITTRNIFGPISAPTPAARPDPNAGKPAPKTPMSLIGTFVTAKEPPYAIIEDDKRKFRMSSASAT